jgi:hypothetical protein
MRSAKLAAICLACALPVIAIGAEPEGANKPQGAPGPGGGFQAGRAGNREAAWRGATDNERAQAMQAFEKMSAEDKIKFREELEKFCATNSPNRWQEVQKRFEINHGMERGPDRRPFAGMGMMAFRFLKLKELKESNPELYQIRVKEIQLEDKAYGLTLERRKGGAHVADIDKELKQIAREHVDLQYKERSLRIAKLETMLADEKRQLEFDKTNAEKEALKRFEGMTTEGFEPSKGQQPPRGDDGRPAKGPRSNDQD